MKLRFYFIVFMGEVLHVFEGVIEGITALKWTGTITTQ